MRDAHRGTARGVAAAIAVCAAGARFGACVSFSSTDAPPAIDGGSTDAPGSDGAVGDANAPEADADVDAPSSAYAEMVLADEPVAYWRMGVTSGATVRDETGHGNTLLLNGAYTTGAAGAIAADPDTAIAFDGTSAFASVASSVPFAFGAGVPFTLECWALREPRDGGDLDFEHVVSYFDVGESGPTNGYLLYLTPNGATPQGATFEYSLSAQTESSAAAFAGAVPRQYVHFAAVFDSTTLTLYLDGRPTDPVPAPGDGGFAARESSFTVASSSAGAPLYFSGSLDEIAVYPKALTAITVQRHHAVGATGPP